MAAVRDPDVASSTGPASEPLGRNRDFGVVLVTQGLSSLGDAVSFTALPLLVLELTGSGLALGVALALQTLSDFAFGLVAGALADRGDRKRLMFVADVGRAILTGLIPLSILLDGPTLAVVLITAIPLGLLRGLFRAGYTSSLPDLVGRPQLARANAIFETVLTAGLIVGPAIAGLLAATIGPGPTLAIDAASFAIAGLGLLLVRRPLRAPMGRPSASIVADIREGIGFIVGHPILRSAILLFGLITMALAPFVAVLAVRITIDLGESPAAYGTILTGYGIGAVAGSLAATRVGRQSGVAVVLLSTPIVIGVGLVGMAVSTSVPVLFLLAAVVGAMESLLVIVYVTVRAAYSPDDLLGRVAGTARVISLGLQPIGLLVAGVLIDVTSGTVTLVVVGIALGLVALAFVPSRALRRATLGGS
jgi:MFS transporter, ENTS family, enterobactin (siderophore) exporter